MLALVSVRTYQHLRLLLHSAHAILVFLIPNVYCLRDIAEYQIAMAVVCLFLSISNVRDVTCTRVVLTCSLPANSRSPRSFTKTVSLRDNRTRSSGSLTGLALDSGESAMVV